MVGEITGDYDYVTGGILPHRRSIRWHETTIKRTEVSEEMKNSTGSIGTSVVITKYATEIESFLKG